jgi:membrane protein implicated in regulation of membrane protease activity
MDPNILAFAWIVWIALILIFGVIEVFTLDFTFLMLAVGSVGGLLASLFGAPWWVQILVAAVLAIVLIFAVRPSLLRALRSGGDATPSNVDALLGLAATATRPFVDGDGEAKLANGETWTARMVPSYASIPVQLGDRLEVVAIEGATAIVQPKERTAS